jgi:hypothetical protein
MRKAVAASANVRVAFVECSQRAGSSQIGCSVNRVLPLVCGGKAARTISGLRADRNLPMFLSHRRECWMPTFSSFRPGRGYPGDCRAPAARHRLWSDCNQGRAGRSPAWSHDRVEVGGWCGSVLGLRSPEVDLSGVVAGPCWLVVTSAPLRCGSVEMLIMPMEVDGSVVMNWTSPLTWLNQR